MPPSDLFDANVRELERGNPLQQIAGRILTGESYAARLGLPSHSQRKRQAATAGVTTAQTASTTQDGSRDAGALEGTVHRLGQRPGREQLGHRLEPAELVERHDHAADQEEHQVEAVGRGQGGERGQRAGHEHADAGERDGRERRAPRAAAPTCAPSTSQPSRRPSTTSTASCSISTTTIAPIFAASSWRRVSGVEPSSLSTPVERSKPVAMARLTIAVDITARARMPGTRKSTGSSSRSGVGSTSTVEKNQSSSTGMAKVSSTDSPAAQGEEQLDPSLREDRLASGLARQSQEHVLEAVAPGPQVGQREVALGQPGGQRGDGGRGGLGVDDVLARAGLVDGRGQRLAEGDGVEPGRSAEADLGGAAAPA